MPDAKITVNSYILKSCLSCQGKNGWKYWIWYSAYLGNKLNLQFFPWLDYSLEEFCL